MYTVWEETPLKWHKFMTFFLLPVGIVANLFRAILVISNPQNWIGILAVLNAVDLTRFIGCAVLGAFSVSGCLPGRRRWYGPKCAIALYSVLAAFCIYNNVAGCALNVADSYYLSVNLIDFILFSLTAILMVFYYRKRRLLFSESHCCGPEIKAEQREHEQNTEDTERIWFVAENAEKQKKKRIKIKSALFALFTTIMVIAVLGLSTALTIKWQQADEYKNECQNALEETERLKLEMQEMKSSEQNERIKYAQILAFYKILEDGFSDLGTEFGFAIDGVYELIGLNEEITTGPSKGMTGYETMKENIEEKLWNIEYYFENCKQYLTDEDIALMSEYRRLNSFSIDCLSAFASGTTSSLGIQNVKGAAMQANIDARQGELSANDMFWTTYENAQVISGW